MHSRANSTPTRSRAPQTQSYGKGGTTVSEQAKRTSSMPWFNSFSLFSALQFVPSFSSSPSRTRRSPLDSPPGEGVESSLSHTEAPSSSEGSSSSDEESVSDLQDLSRGHKEADMEEKVLSTVDVSDKLINETISNNNESITDTGNVRQKRI